MKIKNVYFSLEEREKDLKSLKEFYKEDNLQQEFNKLEALKEYYTDIAKLILYKNWETIDWTNFIGHIQGNNREEFFYIYNEDNFKVNTKINPEDSERTKKIKERLNNSSNESETTLKHKKWAQEKHNPIQKIEMIFDEFDGDFSVNINDKNFMWINNESVMELYNYYEKNKN